MASGTGPGAITDDGCAVDLYAVLPATDEPDRVAAVAPVGATVLELGCGTGRVTHPLVERGYVVTAVDFSPAMLERVHGAQTVHAGIEGLDLDRRFDVVLLASHLVNTTDLDQRDEFLATCARHVAGDGVVLIQRHAAELFTADDEAWHDIGDVRSRLIVMERPAADRIVARVEYEYSRSRWTQDFEPQYVDDDLLAASLERHGLRLDRFLDERRCWAVATPRL